MAFIETPSGRYLRPTASISCRRIAGAKVLRAAVLKAWRLSWSKTGALRALEIRCRPSAAMPLPATTISPPFSPPFSPPSPRLQQHFILNEPNPRPTTLVYLGFFICALCKCICGIWQDWTRGYRCGSSHANPHSGHGYFSAVAHSSHWKAKQPICIITTNLALHCAFGLG